MRDARASASDARAGAKKKIAKNRKTREKIAKLPTAHDCSRIAKNTGVQALKSRKIQVCLFFFFFFRAVVAELPRRYGPVSYRTCTQDAAVELVPDLGLLATSLADTLRDEQEAPPRGKSERCSCS